VHRLLASLEGKGFVLRDFATDKYRLGFRIWELSANMTHSDDPAIILLPEMERLRDQLDETISLYICDGMERVRIQAVESKQAIRRVAAIGARLPLYVGASSKILVAFAAPQVQEALMKAKNMPSGLERSVFLKQLADAKSQGYATSVEERELGAAAVAVPIFNQAHELVASLAVSGPSNRLTIEKMKEHAPVLIEAARRMGKMVR
jgi:IclR family KDG regulon transcriptional repressor